MKENCIEIGKFRLTKHSNKSIWISRIDRDGEGGEFSIKKIEERIESLYEKEL